MSEAVRLALDTYAETIGRPVPAGRKDTQRAYLIFHMIQDLLPCCEELGIDLEAAVRSAKHLRHTGPSIETNMEYEDQNWLSLT